MQDMMITDDSQGYPASVAASQVSQVQVQVTDDSQGYPASQAVSASQVQESNVKKTRRDVLLQCTPYYLKSRICNTSKYILVLILCGLDNNIE